MIQSDLIVTYYQAESRSHPIRRVVKADLTKFYYLIKRNGLFEPVSAKFTLPAHQIYDGTTDKVDTGHGSSEALHARVIFALRSLSRSGSLPKLRGSRK